MGQEASVPTPDGPPQTLSDRSLAAVADHIKSGAVSKIVVMTGAGISTAAGIPDFRSPTTGLYANLARLKLPYPEAVFDIGFFRHNPEPFYVLAKELYPGKFHPTISHVFIALLAKKGLLHLLFTQNIDCLERAAGVPPDLIIEAHGSFASQRCIECLAPLPDDQMHEHVARGEVPRCRAANPFAAGGPWCNGIVKPDIVFFGQPLPEHFSRSRGRVAEADLAIVMGTSLSVQPFASLPSMVGDGVPRLLLNKEPAGGIGARADDVVLLGECDAAVRRLADLLGWRAELGDMWRHLVGEKEAQRQTAGLAGLAPGIKDDLDRLADQMDETLRLDRDGVRTAAAADGAGADADADADADTEQPIARDRQGHDGNPALGKTDRSEADRAPTPAFPVPPHEAGQAEEEPIAQNSGILEGSAKAPQAADLKEDTEEGPPVRG